MDPRTSLVLIKLFLCWKAPTECARAGNGSFWGVQCSHAPPDTRRRQFRNTEHACTLALQVESNQTSISHLCVLHQVSKDHESPPIRAIDLGSKMTVGTTGHHPTTFATLAGAIAAAAAGSWRDVCRVGRILRINHFGARLHVLWCVRGSHTDAEGVCL